MDALESLLVRSASVLPVPLRRLADPARLQLLAQFLRFGVVGTFGFVVDTACVYALRHAMGLYAAGAVAYVVAASANWVLNRVWTFRGQGGGPAHRQWVRFLAVNMIGFVLNRGTYAAMIATMPLVAEQPVIAIAAGSLAGMMVNFMLSRSMVFR